MFVINMIVEGVAHKLYECDEEQTELEFGTKEAAERFLESFQSPARDVKFEIVEK